MSRPARFRNSEASRQLFLLIEELKTRGVTMIYVSHRMPEVFQLCDAISVLRDGKYVGTLRKEAEERRRDIWPPRERRIRWCR